MTDRDQKSEGRSQDAEVRTGEPPGRTKNVERCTDNEWADAIARVLAGDKEAYTAIYQACDRRLRAFVGKRYGHLGGDFADEVAVRTHEYVFPRLNRYDSGRGASFQTWLNWQSLNVAGKVLCERYGLRRVAVASGGRRFKAVTEPFDEATHAKWTRTVPDPAEVHEADWHSRQLWLEYEALAGEGRLSTTLHDIEGWTLAQTAEALKMPLIRLRRLLDRNHNRLRKRLKRRGVRLVEHEPYYGMVRSETDDTGYDDDWSASVTALLPVDPDDLDRAAAREVEEEVTEG